MSGAVLLAAASCSALPPVVRGAGSGPLTPYQRHDGRRLADGVTECAPANCSGDSICGGTTIDDGQCSPCGTGQVWWPCNIAGECYCKSLAPDPTPAPTPSPVATDQPTPSPVGAEGEAEGDDEDGGDEDGGDEDGDGDDGDGGGPSSSSGGSSSSSSSSGFSSGGTGFSGPAIPVPTVGPDGVDPSVLEGLYVMDAHVAANKIVLARELLTPRPNPASRTAAPVHFTYGDFRSALHKMATTPVDGMVFYLGDEVERAYGLVNIAAFLAQSAVDSTLRGGCDEENVDTVGGVLPASNACGQYGMSYQDMTCPEGQEEYQCDVDPTMRMTADDRGSGPGPFYCGPATDYGGFTGHWDYVTGGEVRDGSAMPNGAGREDVEGCCWWGRGSIQLRGVCSYGRLNHFLGKKAHDDGRPSLFPEIDFCRNPQAICSDESYPDLGWVAGLFRWITDVQPYDSGEGWSYMRALVDFVDGGMIDNSFVHAVSGIVGQGCHAPPCEGYEEFDGAERMATFVRTLEILGLRPRAAAAGRRGRRLGEGLEWDFVVGGGLDSWSL